jgi:radical SAM protein with 4Fe4S-binding SPASM domain
MEGAKLARRAEIPLQINTCFAAWNFAYLEDMITVVKELEAVFWEVFFLIPMGRGCQMESLLPQQFESLFDRMHDLSGKESFIIKLTEAQHYRRFVIQKERAANSSAQAALNIKHILARPRGVKNSIGLSPEAVNSGKGLIFIDHVGNICPSGFLPIPAGNIRSEALATIYRDAPLFRMLRDCRQLEGKCGVCEFSAICGGSRARAYAMTGNYLAEDPACAYQPAS